MDFQALMCKMFTNVYHGSTNILIVVIYGDFNIKRYADRSLLHKRVDSLKHRFLGGTANFVTYYGRMNIKIHHA